jgi:hypothetical protein
MSVELPLSRCVAGGGGRRWWSVVVGGGGRKIKGVILFPILQIENKTVSK